MRRSSTHACALALLACASIGCGGGGASLGFAVALRMTFDSSVSDQALSGVRSLTFSGKGDETYMQRVQLDGVALREERTIYRPNPATRDLTIAVIAEDLSGATVASGTTAMLMLSPGETTNVDLTLSAVVAIDAGEDLTSMSDASGHEDLRSDASVDLSAADLSPAATLCPTFTGIACEGFEQAITPPWGTIENSGGTLVEASGEVYRGAYAGHASTPALAANADSTAQLALNNLPTTGTLYMRGFFYMNAAPTSAYVALLRLEQPTSPYGAIGVNVMSNGQLGTENDFAGKNGAGTVLFPLGRWVCVELSAQLATSGAVQVNVDGVHQSMLDISGKTTATPSATQLIAGLYSAAGGTAIGAYDYWLDEIAVDTAPIGCSR